VQLIDGEFCGNNGGWQWARSTGCDLRALCFRFSTQTRHPQTYDKSGNFIKRFVFR